VGHVADGLVEKRGIPAQGSDPADARYYPLRSRYEARPWLHGLYHAIDEVGSYYLTIALDFSRRPRDGIDDPHSLWG